MTDKELQLNNRIDGLESVVNGLNDKLDFLIEFAKNNSFGSAPVSVVQSSSMLYGDWLLEWYSTYKVPKNKDNSLRLMYKFIIEIIIPELGEIPLNKIDGLLLQKFMNTIKTGNTRTKIKHILNGSLRKAVELQKISFNPFSAVEIKKHKTKHYIPLEFKQQNALLDCIKNDLYKHILWVMICTGMRPSEFIALDYKKNVDYLKCEIYVNETVDIETNIKSELTKSECGERKIPFAKSLIPHLKYLEKYIKTVKPITYNMLKCYFRKQYKKLCFVGINLYSFRHTFLSMCYYAEIREKRIQIIAGHATLDLTLNVYTHLLDKGNSPFLDYVFELKKDMEK